MTTRQLAVRNPRTGLNDYAATTCSIDDLDVRTAGLRAAGQRWREQSLAQRLTALSSFGAAIAQAATLILVALETDTGRRELARREIEAVTQMIDAWVRRAPALLPEEWQQARSIPSLRYRAQWCAYPLVGVISPWNFPFLLSFIDVIPALAAGCAVLLKPSEVTPRWIAPLQQALTSVPEVAAVLNIVVGGPDIGAAVIDRADAVCFTGSVATGRKVAVQAAQRMIPAFLELGGKDPLVILASANLQHAVTAALRGSVAATGQACQSIERIYVARSLYDAFVVQLTLAANAVQLNWPDIAHGDIGPIIFKPQAQLLAGQIEDAVQRGARILCGGVIEDHGGGLWLRPTVLVDVDHSMRLLQEETFGPLLPVMPFADESEAIRLANDSVFGLSAAVMAGTLEEAERVGRQIDAGAISLNDAALTTVFAEAAKDSFKQSGLGRSRMGPSGFQRFFRTKALIAQTAAPTGIATFAERPDADGQPKGQDRLTRS